VTAISYIFGLYISVQFDFQNSSRHCSPKYKMIISLDYIDAKNKSDATPEIDTYLCGRHWMQDVMSFLFSGNHRNLDMIVLRSLRME
jgi:hypothetical protein